MTNSESIVAIATPPGKGGIGIVRVSGSNAEQIGAGVTGKEISPRIATLSNFLDHSGHIIDNGIALFFPAQASYTGEPVFEFQGHGSPVVLQLLVERCLQLGARLARPGEFTERAFLNGRIDLTQAEAVADLIDSSTVSGARSAIRSLQGEFANRVEELTDSVTKLRIFVEAAIDFPDEEIDFLEDENVVAQLEELAGLFGALRRSLRCGKILRDGLKVVLTGPPNAGKSSLLNALGQDSRAIVSEIPGTTRDVLEQFIEIEGLPVEILDTAGIRDTVNEIEAEGVRRALNAQKTADLILLVVDNSNFDSREMTSLFNQYQSQTAVLAIRNKIDIANNNQSIFPNEIFVSATTEQGMDQLRQRIRQHAGLREGEDNLFLARQRHIDALDRAEGFLKRGLEQQITYRAGELLADDLTSCHRALGEITGEVSSDDLLGLIFGSFCIGK